MSDPTPRDNDDATPIEPAPAAPASAATAPVPAAVQGRWYGRRLPLLVTAAALILGCLLGGGAVAIAAFAGDGNHGDGRGSHRSRDEHGDNGVTSRHYQNHNGRNSDDQSTPAPSTSSSSAPAVSTPTPSASA
jgi:hypothetical protein